MDPADPPAGFALPPMPPDAPTVGTAPGTARMLRDIWLRPVATMQTLAAAPGRRWLAPLAILVLVSVSGAVAALPASRAFQRQVMLAQREALSSSMPEGQSVDEIIDLTTTGAIGMATAVFSVLGAAIGPVVAVLLVAAVLHLLGTVLGGQQTFKQIFTVAAWARLPLALGGVLWILYLLGGGYDGNPEGLSGLTAADPFVADSATGLATPILGQIELWNLWYLGLLAVAVRAAGRLSRSKAIAAVALLVAMEIGLGLAVVAIGRASPFG